MSMGDLTKNFSIKEFACGCGCGLSDINNYLVTLLQKARDIHPTPIRITSGIRCPQHNRNVGGSESSSHLAGLAVDIACPNSRTRYTLLKALVEHFERIGIADNFIHVDIDPAKVVEVAWKYPPKKKEQ